MLLDADVLRTEANLAHAGLVRRQCVLALSLLFKLLICWVT